MSEVRAEQIPVLVEQGWVRAEEVGQHRLLWWPDGRVGFEHTCDRGPRGVIVCAPRLQLGNGHTVINDEPGHVTVVASILCSDCGTHGFVTDGQWVGA